MTTDTTDTTTLYWTSDDGEGSLHGGDFPADVDREAAEAEFLAELLDQCAGDAEQRAGIEAGTLSWER